MPDHRQTITPDQWRMTIDATRTLAVRTDRSDLADALETETARTRIVVAGDYRQGKSTLALSLLGLSDDLTGGRRTQVPTAIEHGAEPRARLLTGVDDDTPVQIDLASEEGRIQLIAALDEHWLHRTCHVEVPLAQLRTVTLVDLPGIGGLDSPSGLVARSESATADLTIVVTDSSQGLLATELDFVRDVAAACEKVIVVQTKTDLYPEWRRVQADNERLLTGSGIDVAYLPASARLERLGVELGDDTLVAESGIGALRELIEASIGERAATGTSPAQVLAALRQIRGVANAEYAATDPHTAERTLDELHRSRSAVHELRLESSMWRRVLDDGVQDLRHETLDDLDVEIRRIWSAASERFEEGDPAEQWEEHQAWLRTEASGLIRNMYAKMSGRAYALEARVAEALVEAEGELLHADDIDRSPWIGGLDLGEISPKAHDPGRDVEIIAGGWIIADPAVAVGGLLPGFGPVALAIGAVAILVYGRRAARQRKAKQLADKREQARSQARAFLDDAEKLVAREVDKYANALQRHVRDSVLDRILEIERSVEQAIERAEAARAVLDEPASLTDRRSKLADELAKIAELERSARELMLRMEPTDG